MNKLDCGDNSCYFAEEKTGMRTNGGCRCFLKAGFSKSLVSAAVELLPKYVKMQQALETITKIGKGNGGQVFVTTEMLRQIAQEGLKDE